MLQSEKCVATTLSKKRWVVDTIKTSVSVGYSQVENKKRMEIINGVAKINRIRGTFPDFRCFLI